MKKIIHAFLIIICVNIVMCISVCADYEMQYEELPIDSDILYSNQTNNLPMLFKNMVANRYIIDVCGEKYISGDKNNRIQSVLPVKVSGEHPSSTDCIWTGNFYFVRVTDKDGYWPVASQYASPLRLYDEQGNEVMKYDLRESYGQHAEKIGYLNGVYYCQLREERISSDIIKPSIVIMSNDFVNWQETDEAVPEEIGNIILKKEQLALENSDRFYNITYEKDVDYTLTYTLGDWLISRDEENNFYLSNDNVYFVKLQYPKDLLELDKKNDIEYSIRCAYEYNENIVIDLYKKTHLVNMAYISPAKNIGITRLTVSKQNIYNNLYELKTAPYVVMENNILGFETPPVIEDGSTLVPMRFLFEQMGADVEWNQETQTATATLDNTAVTFAIDDTNAEVNNTPATMDVPARLINDKTMVPLRFLSEEMGFDVNWDADSRTAIIE